jgi:intraflagellar transport protein 56
MDLQAALQARDFTAAQTLLRYAGLPREAEEQWRAYLLFHNGRPDAAAEVYRSLGDGGAANGSKSFDLHLASCLFQMGRHQEAQVLAEQGPDCPLKTRLLAHCAAKLHGAAAALDSSPAAGATAAWEDQLGAGMLDDQLSLAALLYGRNDYEAAAAVYGGLLQQFPDLHALHVYLALCCYMLDDWQGSNTHVAAYQVDAGVVVGRGGQRGHVVIMSG